MYSSKVEKSKQFGYSQNLLEKIFKSDEVFTNTPLNKLQKKSKKGGKDQESIQSSTTPDIGYHIRKYKKHN